MLVYEREHTKSLVLGAGLPSSWLQTSEGVSVEGLRTRFGPVSYRMKGDPGRIEIELGASCARPSGGLILALPQPDRIASAIWDGGSWTGTNFSEIVVPDTISKLSITYRQDTVPGR